MFAELIPEAFLVVVLLVVLVDLAVKLRRGVPKKLLACLSLDHLATGLWATAMLYIVNAFCP